MPTVCPNTMRSWCRTAAMAALVIFPAMVHAAPTTGHTPPPAEQKQIPAPQQLMEQTSQQMFDALHAHRDELKQNPKYAYTLVRQVLVPHVDFKRAAHWVLGRYWRSATPAQRQRFVHEFEAFLVRFYSDALSEYAKGHDFDRNLITFLPFRDDVHTGDVTVRSLVHQPNGSSIAVNYQLYHDPSGWKVYDVTVEGISMVTTYRSSFAEEIQKGGIDGLIRVLARRNQKLGGSADAAGS